MTGLLGHMAKVNLYLVGKRKQPNSFGGVKRAVMEMSLYLCTKKSPRT